jgi:hypothetical protein
MPMTDPTSRFESLVDQQIRRAQERGDFDDLPGMGKPLPGWGSQDDEHWWLRNYLHREGLTASALLPTSLRLAREIERLLERVDALPSEQSVRDAVEELNRQVADYRRAPSAPFVPVRPVDVDRMVERWRAAHPLTAGPAGRAEPPPRRRRGGWRRRLVRGRSAAG